MCDDMQDCFDGSDETVSLCGDTVLTTSGPDGFTTDESTTTSPGPDGVTTDESTTTSSNLDGLITDKSTTTYLSPGGVSTGESTTTSPHPDGRTTDESTTTSPGRRYSSLSSLVITYDPSQSSIASTVQKYKT